MPNQEATPRRTVRVPDDLWRQVKLTSVIIRALERYVRAYPLDDD